MLAAGIVAWGMFLTGATGAHAASTQNIDECGCPFKEVILASKTTGATTHTADGKSWDKGVKDNSGATTYTGKQWVVRGTVSASKSIYSAGYRCS